MINNYYVSTSCILINYIHTVKAKVNINTDLW